MNKLIEPGKKHDIDIEIFKEKNNSTDISTLNDKVKLFQITNVTSYIIKAIKNNRCVKIVTENIKNVDEIINTLEEIFNTCLLYTSPSPRDVEESRMPSSA